MAAALTQPWMETWRDPRAILRRSGIRPRKQLGQNFLADPGHAAAIVEAADLERSDIVIEVGPGLGSLTPALADRAGAVVAVELDPNLAAILRQEMADCSKLRIVEGDILEMRPVDLLRAAEHGDSRARAEASTPSGTEIVCGYKVVANLPYYITSAVLRHLLEADVRPERMLVMVQREVADRILARPGDMSILSVAVGFYAIPSLVRLVPAEAFVPAPKVDSAVLRLDARGTLPVPPGEAAAYFQVVRAGFGQRRKQIKNSLASTLRAPPGVIETALLDAGLEPTRRAQTLSLEEWATLTHALRQRGALG